MREQDKITLTSKLAGLLGFEDGASDVLEHLITIDSKEDLSEYLSQLLGDQSKEIATFSDNVHRFQKGLPLTYPAVKMTAAGSAATATTAKPASATRASTSATTAKAATKKPQSKQAARLQARKNKNGNQPKQQKQQKSRVPPPKKQAKPPPPQAAPAPTSTSAALTTTEETKSDPSPPAAAVAKPAEPIQKFHPTRGKPDIICGCFGTQHKALTNCLYCGRISCEKEGRTYCAYCGFQLDDGISGKNDNISDEAYLQKNRLLRFDRVSWIMCFSRVRSCSSSCYGGLFLQHG
mmetsp:Transcript_2278/g.6293  ORF Transcript_2278/g.6293 Transcript_2278/m.6293 type:complete len:293 (-) Transcript_2278:1442-2320(-)